MGRLLSPYLTVIGLVAGDAFTLEVMNMPQSSLINPAVYGLTNVWPETNWPNSDAVTPANDDVGAPHPVFNAITQDAAGFIGPYTFIRGIKQTAGGTNLKGVGLRVVLMAQQAK